MLDVRCSMFIFLVRLPAASLPERSVNPEIQVCALDYRPEFERLGPNVAKVEGAADPRRQGYSCSNLPQALDNAGNAVPSAFP